MNKHHVFLLIILCCILASCNTAKEDTLIIDGWWDVDYAKGVCESAKRQLDARKDIIKQLGCANVGSCPELSKIADACLLDETGGIRDYENNLMTEFASNLNCKSIHVIYFTRPGVGVNKEWEQDHSSLSINFTPGDLSQRWQMVSGPKMSYTQGVGTQKEIADKVCPIVAGAGAKLSN
ncbi:MAG: hypothetical protein D4R39_00715 [Methylophilaceae bacterium]|nr:MAG: hypothetical protein D4R39_00715 [Methylophilaceae bacterium]